MFTPGHVVPTGGSRNRCPAQDDKRSHAQADRLRQDSAEKGQVVEEAVHIERQPDRRGVTRKTSRSSTEAVIAERDRRKHFALCMVGRIPRSVKSSCSFVL